MSRSNKHKSETKLNPVPVCPDRRADRRLTGPFPAKARGVDRSGQIFKTDSTVENIGPGGLYLRLEQPVELQATLFIVAQFTKSWTPEARVARMAMRGRVVRVDRKQSGCYGVAIAITRKRFL